MLPINAPAPPFRLYATPDQQLSLEDFRGSRIILAFYPADWSPVCGDQMALYNEMLEYFEGYNARVVGISVDSRWCHRAFSADRKLGFPLLSDFEPKGAVARLYESYDDDTGECSRAIYIIDEAGIIRWTHISPTGINPGADGILEALDAMQEQRSINTNQDQWHSDHR